MLNSAIADVQSINEDSYDGLVSLIEAGQGGLSLLIASCEPGDWQNQIIKRYEAEFAPNILSYRGLSLEAPDFWSWRNGVFRFVSPEVKDTGVVIRTGGEISLLIEPERRLNLPLEELLEQVENLEQQGTEMPALATLYNRVGQAYASRVKTHQTQEHSQEIDRAINFFHKSLALQKKLNLRTAQSDTLLQLGDIYRNLGLWEEVIDLYHQSLEIAMSLEDRLREAAAWGRLGHFYQKYPQGNRAENIEQAIAAYQLALQVYTRDAFPEQWAKTQNNLANAYSNRIRGDRAENLEQAIAAYQLALQVYTRDTFPEDWAMTQNNLANAYSNRIREDCAENLKQAAS